MTILLVSALISAVIVCLWYNKKKQAIYDEYQKQMEQYLSQLEQPMHQQQTVEEHYTMFFKVKDEHINHWFNERE